MFVADSLLAVIARPIAVSPAIGSVAGHGICHGSVDLITVKCGILFEVVVGSDAVDDPSVARLSRVLLDRLLHWLLHRLRLLEVDGGAVDEGVASFVVRAFINSVALRNFRVTVVVLMLRLLIDVWQHIGLNNSDKLFIEMG